MKKILTLLACCFSFALLHAQVPYTQNTFSYTVDTNIVYGVATNYAGLPDTLLMDVYKPVGDNNCHRPVLVLVHGGSWIAGTKEDQNIVLISQQMAAKGWVVAAINYRLGTHKTSNYNMYALCNTSISAPCGYICDSNEVYRAIFRGMQDTKGAIRFMKSRSTIDSTDNSNVFVAGESAGGFIALATTFTDQLSEKPAACYAIANAPTPDPDLATCNPPGTSFARPDLGSIDGTLNIGTYDAKVKGVGNFYGAVMDTAIFHQALSTDTPVVYMFHQGSDVVVAYTHYTILGRTSYECYAPTNICQPYYFYPWAFGSEAIRQYFVSIGSNAPTYQADIISNYSYGNNCFSNGHSIDNYVTRSQNMADLFGPVIAASGNVPSANCNVSIGAVAEQERFSVFPNPATGSFTIRSTKSLPLSAATLFSVSGQRILELRPAQPVSELVIDKELPAGLYLIRVETTAGYSFVKLSHR